MTPLGSRLHLKVEDEILRMTNEWFFKWHFIGKDGPVEIESFRGRPISYGGIKFSGTAREVYWDTIQHYLRKQISTLFNDVEGELTKYPEDVRRAALCEAEQQIMEFAARIRRLAVEKDRILRGDGFTFPPEQDLGSWRGAGVDDIKSRADSLREIYCTARPEDSSVWQKANTLSDHHRWWIGLVGLILAIFGVLAAL